MVVFTFSILDKDGREKFFEKKLFICGCQSGCNIWDVFPNH